MKDFRIDLFALAGTHATTVASRNSGTLSDRPLLCQTHKTLTPAAAAYTGVVAALDDLDRFLTDEDHVTVEMTAAGGDVAAWISQGSGDPALDARLRQRIHALSRKGVDCALVVGENTPRELISKAEMGHSLGL